VRELGITLRERHECAVAARIDAEHSEGQMRRYRLERLDYGRLVNSIALSGGGKYPSY
jgi:hypothetical protein